MFGRLHLRCVGRQVKEAHAFWDSKARFGMPSGPIQHQQDDPLVPCTDRASEVGEHCSKNGLSMPFDRYQTVSPLAGCTNAVT
jgi:hypothetical protein